VSWPPGEQSTPVLQRQTGPKPVAGGLSLYHRRKMMAATLRILYPRVSKFSRVTQMPVSYSEANSCSIGHKILFFYGIRIHHMFVTKRYT
jgi:hypothetical protein